MALNAGSRTPFGAPDRKAHARAPKGRVCEVADCGTMLSIYNDLGSCSVHEQPQRKPALARSGNTRTPHAS